MSHYSSKSAHGCRGGERAGPCELELDGNNLESQRVAGLSKLSHSEVLSDGPVGT